jgi:hypothetical protein
MRYSVSFSFTTTLLTTCVAAATVRCGAVACSAVAELPATRRGSRRRSSAGRGRTRCRSRTGRDNEYRCPAGAWSREDAWSRSRPPATICWTQCHRRGRLERDPSLTALGACRGCLATCPGWCLWTEAGTFYYPRAIAATSGASRAWPVSRTEAI